MDFFDFKRKFEKKLILEAPFNAGQEPLVSVCVQTFQHAKYIRQCLEAILEQKTTFPFEILLGEDESTDGTREICIEYSEKYPEKIRLFLHSRKNNIRVNKNPTGRFNFLYNLFSARGQYIAFCEGDDYWADPLKLQKQVDFLEANEGFVLTFHDAKITDARIKLTYSNYLLNNLKGILSMEELKQGPYLLLQTLCFRNCVKEFPIEFFQVINGDKFLISLLGQYGKGQFLESITPGVYRHHPGGVWSGKKLSVQESHRLVTYKKMYNYYDRIKDKPTAQYFRELYKNKCIAFLNQTLNFENDRRVALLLWEEKKYLLTFWFTLHQISNKLIGKGHTFRRKFLANI